MSESKKKMMRIIGMNNTVIKNIFAVILLVISCVSILATSKGSKKYPKGEAHKVGTIDQTYNVYLTSNCRDGGVTIENLIKFKDYRIVDSMNLDFYDYGIPTEVITGTNSITGMYQNQNRYKNRYKNRFCDPVLGGLQLPYVWNYSCSENGIPICFLKLKFIDDYPPQLGLDENSED